jgi:hypothetical protein
LLSTVESPKIKIKNPKMLDLYCFGRIPQPYKLSLQSFLTDSVIITGGNELKIEDQPNSAKFVQTFPENSIIQNFDCQNGGCGDLGERLQKMFENLKRSSLKNQPLSVPKI